MYLTLPQVGTSPYIPLAAVYVACLFSCLMTRYMSTYLGKVVGYSLQSQPVQVHQYLTLATGKSAMVHQTPPSPFLSSFPSQRHVSSRPRVGCKAACAEKEKNRTSLATLHRVYHSLFFSGTDTEQKNVYLLYLFETRERKKKKPVRRQSLHASRRTIQYAGGRDSGYRRAQHRLVGFTVVCTHVPPSQRGRYCRCV